MALEVSDISVHFGGLAALENVTLEVRESAITGLIGPNGAGKSTLFDVITGMRKPNSGMVSLNGQDLRGVSPYRRSHLGLGRTFQRLELFGTLTVRENVRVAASVGRRQFWSMSEKREVNELTNGLLHRVGLQDIAEARADTLPTGTGRLVELARALAIGPKILLLDEPASGQSPEETARFAEMLRSLSADGLAILLVEHDMDLVMSVCHEVYVLVSGKVLSHGTPDEIQRDPEVATAYLGNQVETGGG
jgi:branched-chain amino acid transport system ATP-binding protein